MSISVFAYSHRGCETAEHVKECLPEAVLYCAARLEEPDFLPIPKPSRPFYGECFLKSKALVFVGSCGIAVREIAPFVKDKKTDPAVIVIDELGRFVIPILSGHMGGANALGRTLAEYLGAGAVITTATDINGKFSVDAWAARNGFVISNMALAKAVSAEILEHDVPFSCDFPIAGDLPSGTYAGSMGTLGIAVSVYKRSPFEKTLQLIPKILHVGIGCRKNTPAEKIREAVKETLEEQEIDLRAVKCAASIDLKKDEMGLLQVCRENNWPVIFYSAGELKSLSGDFSSSEFVESVTGVDSVCERSACMGADRLIVKKTARNGVTVAVAAEKLEVRFG